MLFLNDMRKIVLTGILMLLTVAALAQEKIWSGTACKSRQVTLKEYLPEGTTDSWQKAFVDWMHNMSF